MKREAKAFLRAVARRACRLSLPRAESYIEIFAGTNFSSASSFIFIVIAIFQFVSIAFALHDFNGKLIRVPSGSLVIFLHYVV